MSTRKKGTVVSPRISDDVAQQLVTEYGTRNAGAARAIEVLLPLRAATMHRIREYLDEQELALIRATFAGVKFDADSAIAPSYLCSRVETVAKATGLLVKHPAVELDDLIKNLKNFTPAESLFLTDWACRA